MQSNFLNVDRSFERNLEAGEYFFRIYNSSSSSNTNYTIKLSSPDLPTPLPVPTPAPIPKPTPTPATTPVNIPTPASLFDVDGSSTVSFARDGLLISALLFFYKSDRTNYNILDKFILDSNAKRKTGNDIANNLKGKIDNFDIDDNGQVTFARDGLLISAFLFFYKSDRTDYNILDKFILDSNAKRKTGNEIADYLKSLITGTATGASHASTDDLTVNYNSIIGTAGDDFLRGDINNNLIVGNAGNDILTGDIGKDIFSFDADSGNDKITDFNIAEDLIQIDDSLGFTNTSEVLAAISYQGSTAELGLSEGNRLTIELDGALTIANLSLG